MAMLRRCASVGGMLFMPDEPKRDNGSRNRMAPMRRVQNPVEPRVPKRGYPDQQPPKPPRGTKNGSGRSKKAREGYVRIRVLVQDGTLSVAGAKFVEGPLVETDAVHPGLVCEMMLGSRRLAPVGFPMRACGGPFPIRSAAPACKATTSPKFQATSLRLGCRSRICRWRLCRKCE